MSRVALTVRIPEELLDEAKCLKSEQESLNDLIVEAVAREVRCRQARDLADEIAELREEIRRKHGVQPDSSPIIRTLREGNESHA